MAATLTDKLAEALRKILQLDEWIERNTPSGSRAHVLVADARQALREYEAAKGVDSSARCSRCDGTGEIRTTELSPHGRPIAVVDVCPSCSQGAEGWHDMASVPKDGTPIILWCAFGNPDEAVIARWAEEPGEPGPHGRFCWLAFDDARIAENVPIGWLPAPEQP